VLLLHGNSEDVVNGLEQIIELTTARGYKIVPLNEI
jgi:peptidoglycan-N-acetylmuramic acid deacetylase